MSSFEAIVLGADANGLTAAAVLARRGLSVLVVEPRGTLGGMAVGDPIGDGLLPPGPMADTTSLSEEVVGLLDLESHGLRWRGRRPSVVALGAPGTTASLDDRQPGCDGFRRTIETVAPLAKLFVCRPPLNLIHPEQDRLRRFVGPALKLRGLGRREMLELLRLPPMPVGDFVAEQIDDPLLQAAVALPAVIGSFAGPRSPGTAFNLLLSEAIAGPGVDGDGPALIAALEACARSMGVEIRTGAVAERILIENGRAAGVVVAGEAIRAPLVAVASEPKRALLDLLPEGALSERVSHRLRCFRTRGTTSLITLIVDGALALPGYDEGELWARLAPDLDAIERAFDAVKYGELPREPVLEIHGSAPAEGRQVVTIRAGFVPYHLRSGWSESVRREWTERVVSRLEAHVPGLSSKIVDGRLLTPEDIETVFGATGGNVHLGEHALDQRLVRPIPECVGYRTPVSGLYLCGGGSHPGGELTCIPGALAARVMLDS